MINLKELINEILNEGVDDPGILKCVFMAGGPGSGKSYTAKELFGVGKKTLASVSSGGLKLVNSDTAFEKEHTHSRSFIRGTCQSFHFIINLIPHFRTRVLLTSAAPVIHDPHIVAKSILSYHRSRNICCLLDV